MDPKDDATIVDHIANAFDAPKRGTPEFNKAVTDATNVIRKLVPELKEAPQHAIIQHLQASNRPVDGNGQFVSNFVAYEEIAESILASCQNRVQGTSVAKLANEKNLIKSFFYKLIQVSMRDSTEPMVSSFR